MTDNTVAARDEGHSTQSSGSLFELFARNRKGIKQVEEVIRSKLQSEASLLEEIPNYLLDLGGKRIRPQLTLTTGRLFGLATPPQQLLNIAAGIELIHMATLLHDDIIDKSEMRRHHESAYLKYGTTNTLLTGDFLLVRAFSLCALLDDFVIRATEDACVALTEGEILETSLVDDPHDLDSSLMIARKKTAALFKLAGETAAHIAKMPDTIVTAMAELGELLGISFQILDDILDVTSTAKQLGKPRGADLRERKPSVVNVLWLESGDPAAAFLREPPSKNDEQLIEEGLKVLSQSQAIKTARELAIAYTDRAGAVLSEIAESQPSIDPNAHEDILALIDFTVKRVA